jgi:hypothetical protein
MVASVHLSGQTPVKLNPLQKPARLVTSDESLVTGAVPLDARLRRVVRHSNWTLEWTGSL